MTKKILLLLILIIVHISSLIAVDSNEMVVYIPRTGLRKIPSPNCSKIFFCQTSSKKSGFIGVENDHEALLWKQPVDINVILIPIWSKDERYIGILTNAPYNKVVKATIFRDKSFIYLIEASTGHILNKRDVDLNTLQSWITCFSKSRI